MSDRLRPSVLTAGARIGVVSPSSAVASLCPKRFERGVRNLEALGFVPVVGKTATSRTSLGYTSGSPEARADDINRMFADARIDAIIATIGGNAVNHILDHVDLATVARNPKFLIGYSDITLLQAALWQSVRLTSVAGPGLLAQFGEPGGLHPFTRASLLATVCEDRSAGRLPASMAVMAEVRRWDIDDTLPRSERRIGGPTVERSGDASGHLIPVNVESLLALSGTEWFPDLNNAVLVLEAAETTSAARFHQALYQLRSQGVFRRISGLIIGRFDDRSQCPADLISAIIDDVSISPAVPIISNVDFGHTDPLLSLPWGVATEVHARDGCAEILIVEAAGVGVV